MKRAVLLSVIVAASMFLAACGNSAPTEQPQQPQQPAATQAAPAGGSGAQSSAGTPTEVDVTLADNTIQSSLTTFRVGVPYRFVIVNNGNHLHDFNIATPVDKAGSLDAALSSALVSVPQDQLPIGGGTTVTYTFPASAAGQTLEMSCLIRRHYEDGMRLAIQVTQ
jgi:uncharacterized cupredoxin-like copper-binding protein